MGDLDGAFSIFRAANEAPDRPFVIEPGQQWSYGQLARHVVTALRRLDAGEAGATRTGVPLAIVAHNGLPTIVACLAAFERGWPALLLHPRWSSAERSALAQQAGASSEPLHPGPGLLADEAQGTSVEAATRATRAAAPLAIVFTSGSCRGPKGVVLSRAAFLAAANASADNLGWRADDRWLLSLPLAHIGGLSVLTRCLAARIPLVLPATTRVSFEPRSFVGSIERTSTTLLSLVPTQLKRIVDARLRCPRSVRAVLIGGASLTGMLREQALALGWPVLATYGLTEACSQVATERYRPADTRSGVHLGDAGAALERPDGVCGPPLSGIEVRIGSSGSIEVRSPTLLSGYHLSQAAPLDDAGWFRTGDLGELLPSGQLRVLGRADDVIISGGENVHPQHVEQVLIGLPGVTGACVFGLNSDEWGQLVAAAVVGEDLDLSVVREQAKARLGAINCPKRWVRVSALPLNANGKLDRRRARDELGPRCHEPAPGAEPAPSLSHAVAEPRRR